MLSSPRIEHIGTPFEVDRHKAIALITYLALTEGVVFYGDDFMAGYILPDSPALDEGSSFKPRACARRWLPHLSHCLQSQRPEGVQGRHFLYPALAGPE
jgi:hypothetical protein